MVPGTSCLSPRQVAPHRDCRVDARASVAGSPRLCRPEAPNREFHTGMRAEAAAVELEVRFAMANRDLADMSAKLRQAESRLEDLESQVSASNMARHEAEASIWALEERALAAEARAADAEAKMWEWQAHASVMESRLAGTLKNAKDLERRADNATMLLSNEVERRAEAESRAKVAEVSMDSLSLRMDSFSRKAAIAEARAPERITAAEIVASRRAHDAEKQLGMAKERAWSSSLSAGLLRAELRGQQSLPPESLMLLSARTSSQSRALTGARVSPRLGISHTSLCIPARRLSHGSSLCIPAAAPYQVESQPIPSLVADVHPIQSLVASVAELSEIESARARPLTSTSAGDPASATLALSSTLYSDSGSATTAMPPTINGSDSGSICSIPEPVCTFAR